MTRENRRAHVEADYNRFFVFTHEGAAEEVAVADRFCAACRALLEKDGWA